MKPILRIAALLLLVGALVIFAAGAIAAEGALHPARRHVASLCPCIAHTSCRDATVHAPDGATLRAWYYEPDRPNGGAVLSLHGVGASREDMVAVGAVFLRAGYAVLEPDLRGHGESGGITTYGIAEEQDVHAWAEWMLRQPAIHRLYGFGVSLGGSVLLEGLNSEPRFRAVIAESAYSDFTAIANERMRRLMPNGFKWVTAPFVESGILWTRLRYGISLDRSSALNAVQRTHVPILLIHGLADANTVPENSRILAAANPAETRLWLIPNDGHAAAWRTARKEFESRVIQWFMEHP